MAEGKSTTPRKKPKPFTVNAGKFGVCGDGITDDTAALQRALDACDKNNGGVLQLPPGNYCIRGNLVIPQDVTLEGVFSRPPAWNIGRNTVLHAFAGRGEEEGPAFITLGNNATLRGLAIYYPEQDPDAITPYPWCVSGDSSDDVAIVDCMLVNPYQGLNLGQGRMERHYVSNVYGMPLRRGLFVDTCTDIGRIENVHFWPFWRESLGHPATRQFLNENGEAFIFGRSDWQFVTNTFCWGYNTAYRFMETRDGVCNGNFVGIAGDSCNISVLVENAAPYGLLITNGQFVAIQGRRPRQIRVRKTHAGSVQFSNCSFWGLSDHVAHIEGTGFVGMNQCHILDWRTTADNKPAILIESGQASITNCRFAKGGTAVEVGPEAQGVIVSNNIFSGPEAVRSSGSAPVVAQSNLEVAPAYEIPANSWIVDVRGADVEMFGIWPNLANKDAYNGQLYFARKGEGETSFAWNLRAGQGHRCTVSVWLPHLHKKRYAAEDATYTIRHANGEDAVPVNLQEAESGWVPLGEYDIDSDSRLVLTNKANGFIVADAVLLTKTSKA